MNFFVGKKFEETCIFTLQDVIKFAKLSGDVNPIHLNPEFAKNTPFKKTIVHGFLYASKISKIIANSLPGPGSIYLFQDLNFLNPVFHDEEIIICVEIIEIKVEKNIFTLKTTILKKDGLLALSGKAVIKLI